eukprot:gene11912-2478_t
MFFFERIHEKIQNNYSRKSGKQESILLDIDKRYAQFLPATEFLHYNMFNNFFFGGEDAKSIFKEFLSNVDSKKIALVMDPPFGGLMSLLASSIGRLRALYETDSTTNTGDLTIVMIFPYFLESHVSEAFPTLNMTDYRVCYENHPNFKQRTAERGSPIRIFTNIPDKDFVLPASDGYRFCKVCKRYVAANNIHCAQCNACTSKDGRQYVHCEMCQKCVKPGTVPFILPRSVFSVEFTAKRVIVVKPKTMNVEGKRWTVLRAIFVEIPVTKERIVPKNQD